MTTEQHDQAHEGKTTKNQPQVQVPSRSASVRVRYIGQRRYWALSFRVAGSEEGGFPVFATMPKHFRLRGWNVRQRTLQRRREALCAHAHISGGGKSWEGEWQDWQCDDCGQNCPERRTRLSSHGDTT